LRRWGICFKKIHWKILSGSLLGVLLITFILNVFILQALKNRNIEIRANNIIASARLIAVRASHYLDRHDYLNLICEEYAKTYGFRVMVFDSEARVIADSLREEVLLGNKYSYEEVISALKGKSKAGVHLIPSQDWVIYASTPINAGGKIAGAILVSAYVNDIFGLLQDIRYESFFMSLGAIILVSLISILVSLRITRPITEMAQAAKRVSKGELGLTVEVKNKDEIGELAYSFNEMSQRLNEIDINRKRFFHNISHELKTPLASAILLTDSILADADKGKMPRRDFLTDIQGQLYSMNSLIQEFSLLARLGEMKLINPAPVDVLNVCQKVESTLQPLCKKKEVSLEFIDSKQGPYQVWGNDSQLFEAILNIGENAVKFSSAQGRVLITLAKDSNNIVITIQDNGIGIPEEDLDRIFTRFYRVDTTPARELGGSGLGLSIAQAIINLHGGQIKVDSTWGKGTIVTVILPQQKSTM
jgi:signal transduction histidine kinase